MELEKQLNVKPFNCIDCNYHTTKPSDWVKHVDSKKHERHGGKKESKCNKCDYKAFNHWNLKIHILSQHSTLEERIKSKYYCDSCDRVFFSQLYKDRHDNGKRHSLYVRAIELQKKVDEDYKLRHSNKDINI
jgi:hypothetical protein